MTTSLAGRRRYTSVMVSRLWGFQPGELEKRVAAGDLPTPLQPDRYDADEIDRIYWQRWHQQREAAIAAIATVKKSSALHLPPSPALADEYFRRRQSTLAHLADADLEADDRLWHQTCGLPVEAASETGVSKPEEGASDAEGPRDRGVLLRALQPGSAPEISTFFDLRLPRPTAHRPTYRTNAICETCGAEFKQPRGPSSKFCSDCRKSARREAARAHMRKVRGQTLVKAAERPHTGRAGTEPARQTAF